MQLADFALERYFAEFEFSAKHLLSSSDCEPIALQELLDRADPGSLKLWEHLQLAYTESMGLPLLREVIASLYQGMNASEILVAGPQESIFLAMNVLLEPGEKVVVTYPGYQSLYEIAQSKACKVSFWKPDVNHHFSLADLEPLLDAGTRMLVINFPHNPTGAHLHQIEFNQIIEWCRERNIILFSDEMYRFLEYDSPQRLPSACEVYENSVTLCGMSKSFALPGLRLGWLLTKNKVWLQRIQSFKDYTTICNPGPSEVLALMALKMKDWILNRNLEIIRSNLGLMEQFAQRHSHILRWIPPQAGSVAFPELLINKDIAHFCRCFVEKKGVMLLPGTVYGYPGNFFRLGLGRRNFSEALAIFEEFIK